MIAQDQIRQLAVKYQTTELNIRREYFQHLFLSYFYQQPQSKNVYFKGGTALKILYQSPRFSEDLDFSATYKDARQIEQAILSTLSEIKREGIEVELSEAKETSGGYLAVIAFGPPRHIVSLQLHISLREGEKKGEIVAIVDDFIPSYTLIQLSRNQLVDEKVKALLTRKKPRDFYDFYFILRSNLMPAAKKEILPQVLRALQETEFNFDLELRQFLPKSHWGVIKDLKKTLAAEIERFI